MGSNSFSLTRGVAPAGVKIKARAANPSTKVTGSRPTYVTSCAATIVGRLVKYTTRYAGRYVVYAKNKVTLYMAPASSVVRSAMGRSVTISALGAVAGSACSRESGRSRRKGM